MAGPTRYTEENTSGSGSAGDGATSVTRGHGDDERGNVQDEVSWSGEVGEQPAVFRPG